MMIGAFQLDNGLPLPPPASLVQPPLHAFAGPSSIHQVFQLILPTCKRRFLATAPGPAIGFRRALFWSACPGRNRRIVSEGAKARGCLLALTACCFGVHQDFSWCNHGPTGAVRGTCRPGPKGVLLLPGRTALPTSFIAGSRR